MAGEMDSRFLADLTSLTMAQKTLLAKGKVQTVKDLLLKPPADLAKKCKITLKDMEALVDLVCKELAPQPRTLREVAHIGEEKFTTGDPHLDEILDGGIRTGMLWDISGENNAGKSQLAMQLSLTVQLPTKLGGIHGSACYITTRDELATPRLNGMIDHHPLLSPDVCGLTDIHTIKVPFFPGLQKVLLETVPAFADERARTPGAKQLKLIVIDTLTDVFDQIKDPKYEDVPLRAKDLKKLSLLLHRLASNYQLAVVVLGATRETKPRSEGGDRAPGELRFSDQSRWFCRGHSIPGEDDHEAILGHVWPNQLNVRIMMSRTIRTRARCAVDPRGQTEGARAAKRRKLEGTQERTDIYDADQQISLRRFSVLFSSVGPPGSCDYVILSEGVVGIPIEEPPPSTHLFLTPPLSASQSTPASSTPDMRPDSIRLSGNGSTQQPRPRQSLSYEPSVPPSPAPPSSLPALRSPPPFSSPSQSESVTSPAGTQSVPPSSQSAAMIHTHSVPPPSQSVVPSSQPDLDEDWDMYWKDTDADDALYASVEDRMAALEPAVAAAEAAEAGPPVENDPDSDYYWDE